MTNRGAQELRNLQTPEKRGELGSHRTADKQRERNALSLGKAQERDSFHTDDEDDKGLGEVKLVIKQSEDGSYDDPRRKVIFAHEKEGRIMEVNETDASKNDKVYTAKGEEMQFEEVQVDGPHGDGLAIQS